MRSVHQLIYEPDSHTDLIEDITQKLSIDTRRTTSRSASRPVETYV